MKNCNWKTYFLLFFAFSMFFSCQKDDDDTDDMMDDTMTTETTYQPLTVGNSWTYEEITWIGDTVTYTQTVSAITKDFNGNTYHQIDRTNGYQSSYLRCDEAGTCYEVNDNSTAIDGVYEWDFLQDVAAGTVWEFDYTYQGNPNQYVMEVTETGGTRTVKGTTYTDVITVTRNHIYYDVFSDAWTEVGDSETETAWYAKGVGLIEMDSFFGIQRWLLSYDVE